jgi:hypothetical protein
MLKRVNTGARLSHAQQLPYELLKEIFDSYHYARLEWLATVNLPRWIENGPWTLGLVCSRWRAVVISCPRLWSKIDISVLSSKTITDYNRTAALDVFHEGLRRSGNTLIKLGLISGYDDALFMQAVLDTVNSISSRVVEFRLDTIFRSHLNALDGHFPSLKVLDLTCIHALDELVPPCLRLLNAPRLEELELGAGLMMQFTSLLSVPWRSLVSLTIPRAWIREVATMIEYLRHGSRLRTIVYISFDGYEDSQPPLPAPSITSLPYLTELEVSNTRLFPLLHLPSLQMLIIRNESNATLYHHSLQLTAQLIERSGCQLKSLTIVNVFGDISTEFITMLKTTPYLKELAIEFHPGSVWALPRLLHTLAASEGAEDDTAAASILPNLRRLYIGVRHPHSPPNSDIDGIGGVFNRSLSCLLGSRWTNAKERSRLSSLVINFAFEVNAEQIISPDVFSTLRQAAEDGLDVSISDKGETWLSCVCFVGDNTDSYL